MSKLKKMLNSPRAQMAFATGVSILAIACASRWLLPKPINPLLLTIPPLIEATYEGLLKKYKEARFLKAWYWVGAILLSTSLLIILHLV